VARRLRKSAGTSSQAAHDVWVRYTPATPTAELLVEIKGPPRHRVILIPDTATSQAVEAMRVGAYDYITKPFRLARGELVIERAYQRVCLERENRTYRHSKDALQPPKLIGNSQAIKHIRYLMEKVAPTDAPVLITGQSGVGKDVVAHGIQALGKRANKPFIIKNCATLQKELMRSELFGHTRGAFTGAMDNRDGLLAFADTGTLFLDEIGKCPWSFRPRSCGYWRPRPTGESGIKTNAESMSGSFAPPAAT
jgi:two-component system NtrC family response regulator